MLKYFSTKAVAAVKGNQEKVVTKNEKIISSGLTCQWEEVKVKKLKIAKVCLICRTNNRLKSEGSCG